MSRFSRAHESGLLWMAFSLAGLVLVGCSSAPGRDVAYDPFVPSAVIKHRRTGAVSVAYRGPLAEMSGRTTVTEERSKEILVFEE